MPGRNGGQPNKANIGDERPDCPECEGFMKSDGADWKCVDTSCGRYVKKNPKTRNRQERDEGANQFGYDVEAAERRAEYIRERYAKGCKNFVVVSAQNNTRVFKGFWDALQVYCKHNKAELVVIASHYKNMDAWNRDDNKYWVDEVQPYIVHGDIELGDVTIKAKFKISATTLYPLAGKQAHGAGKWSIFGHPQHAMQSIATPGDEYPLRQYTTGSCTRENYSVSDIGERARFNHIFGALTINFRKKHKYPFIRLLTADGVGSFYDLDKRYTSTKVTTGHRIECLTPGDEHVKFNACEKAMYTGKNSIAGKLRPKRIFRHDVLDGYAGSHHHEHDDVLQFRKFHQRDDDYRAELDELVDFINRTTPKDAVTLIVPSNHDEHLDKWLRRTDARKDPRNALLIMELRKAQYENSLSGKTTNALQIYLEPRLKCKYEFLSRNRAYMVDGVDHAQHGDKGTKGSRGSLRGFSRMAHKMTVAHSHTPGVEKGVQQVGKSTGDLEYESGYTDTSITCVIQYPGGKRTPIDIYGNDWC